MKNYKVSVVIPIFNQEKEVNNCVKTLRKQTIDFQRLEIILINDGSEDKSGELCEQLSRNFSNITCIHQKNKGVSNARNTGIRVATGKYIVFLDADDTLSQETIKEVTTFFDSIYESVDLVTYRIETLYNGRLLPEHFRYKYLVESGIYDLREHSYIGQTTMNIVVKNKFNENIFFDEMQTFSEDQKYCCEVLANTLKMGYCKSGTYIYKRSSNSSSGNLAGSCYIFEQCMKLFEDLFKQYQEVPLAFQGLYVNDFYWKLHNNILFPYHYDKSAYQNAIERLYTLLNRCDNHIILEHPNIDFFEKYYLLNLKNEHDIQSNLQETYFELTYNKNTLVREHSIELVITKLNYHNNKVIIEGFIKTVFLQFYQEDIMICAVENDGKLITKLPLVDSAHNYYLSHEKTQKFKAFHYECKPDVVRNVGFKVEMGGRWYSTHYYFMPLISLSHIKQGVSCKKGNIKISLDKSNFFQFEPVSFVKEKIIWLYYDCAGVSIDNGYLQFKHDILKQDGIERYYILTDNRQGQDEELKKHCIRFGSKKHEKLLKQCKKIITAYIEEPNLIPYDKSQYERRLPHFNAEIIYLQHGVLHIIMPWKYSREHMLADKIVVSTVEECELYRKNGYKDENLIKTAMPRFEHITKHTSKKKILYAPSWRRYLVGDYIEKRWVKMDEKFIKSQFFKKVNTFLNSKVLSDFLEKNNYSLEFKLHPIFQMYKEHFKWNSSKITFVSEEVIDGEYDLFITDYSSYLFNFMYLSIPIIHFIPDKEEFKAGMNGYRELNYPETFWEDVAEENHELFRKLEKVLLEKIQTMTYATFYRHNNISEKIYQALIKNEKEEV